MDEAAMMQSFRYETAQLRLQCLQLASGFHLTDPSDVVRAAGLLYDFVCDAPKETPAV